jgi:ribosomal protein L35
MISFPEAHLQRPCAKHGVKIIITQLQMLRISHFTFQALPSTSLQMWRNIDHKNNPSLLLTRNSCFIMKSHKSHILTFKRSINSIRNVKLHFWCIRFDYVCGTDQSSIQILKEKSFLTKGHKQYLSTMITKQHNTNKRKTTRKRILPGGSLVSATQFFKGVTNRKSSTSVALPQTI